MTAQADLFATAKPPKPGTQADRVLSILKGAPSGLARWHFYEQCRTAGVLNPRARVSDLRDRGYVIEGGFAYRLVEP